MAKLTLDFQPQFDFILYGVSCHVKNYKFIYNVNNNIRVNFERTDDIELLSGKSKAQKFPVYSYNNEEDHTYCDIVANRSSTSYLVPEQKQIDYFLLLNEPILEQEVVRITDGIKKLKIVNIIYKIDLNSLKSKQNLLL